MTSIFKGLCDRQRFHRFVSLIYLHLWHRYYCCLLFLMHWRFVSFPKPFAFLFWLRLHVRVDPCRKRERGNEIYEDMEWVPRLQEMLRKFIENWMDESAHWVRVPFFPPTLLHLFTLCAPLVRFRKLCSKFTIFSFLLGFKMLKQFRYFTNLANLVVLVIMFYSVS